MSIKIEYICHATLLIEIDGVKLLTDPWTEEPAYCNQWHLFPKPLDGITDRIKNADHILLSHGHEDHLHEHTLKKINKTAQVLYPYTWYGDATKYFKYLGFEKSKEVKTGEAVTINKDLRIHYISHNLDSVIIIEYKDQVIVNVNDALHSTNPNAISYFTRLISQRWKKIDYVFCGFGGASYFPNCYHAAGKDDVEVAKTRESLFVNNFARIANELNPRTAVPFAADFVLLNPETKWINTARINRSLLPQLYAELYPNSKVIILPMYAGDSLSDHRLLAESTYRVQMKNGSLDHLIAEQYSSKLEELAQINYRSETETDMLLAKLEKNIAKRIQRVSARLKNIRFNIHVADIKNNPNIDIEYRDDQLKIERRKEPANDVLLDIHTRSEILHYSLDSDWGGDCITIGYGVQVYIKKAEVIENSVALYIVGLLTNHPNENDFIMKQPLRGMNFVLANSIHKDFFWKKITRNKDTLREKLYSKDQTYSLSTWLSKDKCEICKICALPDLEEKYFN